MMQRIRSTAFTVFLIGLVVVMGVALSPMMLFGKNPSRAVIQYWARLTLGGLKRIAGVSYRIEGAENIPVSGALIAANHQSMWETIALYALTPKPVMIFKKELLQIPIYGWWAARSGNIAVDRKGGAKALRDMSRAAKDRTGAGEQIVIFPEGTRMQPGQKAPLQPGVAGVYAATGAPCTPVAHDSGRHWRHPSGGKTPGVITIRFLPPIEPGLDRRAFLRELKARIESARPDLVEGSST
ncbi:MAG: lysophospholipid acyltransferase family protein [Pseudomonadota bacterium]